MKTRLDERRWVISYAMIIMLITSLPYLAGFWQQDNHWVFTGFVFGVEDGNSYLAKMLSGSNGNWLFRTPYTALPQKGFFAFFPYILIGKLAAPPGEHEQLVALFQLFRWVAGILCVLATYDLIALFIEPIRLRRIGVIVASIGGGLGWVSVLGLQSLWGGRLPLEFYSPESFGFLELYGLPHLAMGRAFLLWGVYFFLKHFFAKTKTRTVILTCGILWILLGFMQPLTVIIGWTILSAFLSMLAIYYFWQEKKGMQVDWVIWRQGIFRLLGLGLISSPIVVYTGVKFLTDPFLAQWAHQNIIKSPPLVDYLLAYGLFIPIIIRGINRVLKDHSVPGILLVSWLIIFPVLAYFPINLQRRLPEGIWVAITILGIASFTNQGSIFWKQIPSIFPITLFPALILLIGGILVVSTPSIPIFRPEAETKAANFLSDNVIPGQVVLASYETSNALPAWVPIRTLIGHGPESIRLAEMRPEVERFFQSSTSEQDRLTLINKFNISFIFYGPSEQALGNWIPDKDKRFSKIYQDGDWNIFRVINLSP